MKQFSFLILTILFLASCEQREIRGGLFVEKVQESDLNEFLYKVHLNSDKTDGVAYYTDYKYVVGDTLASIGEFNFKTKEKFENQSILIDSLLTENESLKKEIEGLKLFNRLLISVVKDSIRGK